MTLHSRILIFILFVSSYAIFTVHAKVYHLGLIKVNTNTAQDYCKAVGWRLAAITNRQDDQRVLQQIKDTGIRYQFWTAGKKNGTDTGRNTHFYWVGHEEPFSYTNWFQTEPNNQENGNDYCINLRNWNDGGLNLWDDDFCSNPFYFVCEEESTSRPTTFSSQPVSTQTGTKVYHLIAELKVSWYNALHYCSTRGWRFAAVHSKTENDQMLELIRSSGLQDNFWLAGTNAGNESNSKFYWMGHDQPVIFSYWHSAQSNNLKSNKHCLQSQYGSNNGLNKWNVEECDTKNYFICEEGTASTQTTTANDAKTYHLITDLTYSWYNALNYCSARGWRLAAIDSKEENDKVVNLIKNSGSEEDFWLAGTEVGYPGRYYWMGHDKKVTFTDWHPGPWGGGWDKDCIKYEYSPTTDLYQWGVDFCNTELNFICEERPTSQTQWAGKMNMQQEISDTGTGFSYVHHNVGDCIVTHEPDNGWIENVRGRKLAIGETVNQFETVKYKCDGNGIIDGATVNLCYRGNWTIPIPDCQIRCSPESISGLTIVAISCSLDDTKVQCTRPAKPGTQAHVYCRERYERKSGPKLQIMICGEDGLWTPTPQPCSPICGEEVAAGTPFIVGGFQSSINEVPWHVGIYKFNGVDFGLECGGTIINERTIVSAMHCFWDPSTAKPFDVSLYRIAAGKDQIDYDAIENQKDQKFEVEKLLYDPGYHHATNNYVSDIVMVVLKTPIEFRSYIGPICFPYGLKYDEVIVPTGWKGRVAGWGKTESGGAPSKFLKTVELPVIDKAKCFEELGIEFQQNITPDKFCAGFLNENVSVCQGDSGGGLVFNKTENGRVKWYLRGIVSVGARKRESCDSDKYTTFTNVAYHERLILANEPNYRPPR